MNLHGAGERSGAPGTQLEEDEGSKDIVGHVAVVTW